MEILTIVEKWSPIERALALGMIHQALLEDGTLTPKTLREVVEEAIELYEQMK
jgi:hypothetical protein